MPRFNRTLVILHFLSHPQYRPPQHDPRLDEPETLRLLLLWLSQRNHPHILDSDLMKEFVALTGAIRPALDSILRLMKTIDEVIEKCMEQQGPRPRDVFHSQLRVDSSMILRINVELMMARRALMDLERLIAAQAYMRGILRELAYMIDRYTLEIEEFLRHSANQSAERQRNYSARRRLMCHYEATNLESRTRLREDYKRNERCLKEMHRFIEHMSNDVRELSQRRYPDQQCLYQMQNRSKRFGKKIEQLESDENLCSA